MSRPCISYVNICSIIVVVVVTVVVFVDLVLVNDDDDDDDDINFPICYSGCLWTKRRHSQIRKEDHGPSISTCPAMDYVRIESLVLPNGKTCVLIYVYQPSIYIKCLFLTVGHCGTSLSVSAIIGRGHFGHGSVYFATRS